MPDLELVLTNRAHRAIAEARSVDEVKDIMDKAEAVRLYVKRAGLGKDMENDAAEIVIRAERKMGELLKTMREQGQRQSRGGDRKSKSQDKTLMPPSLDELGVSRGQASRAEMVADLPEAELDKDIAKARADGGLTPNVARKAATKHKREKQRAEVSAQRKAAPAETHIDLYQGDAFAWLETVEDGSIDLVVTDPPYNVTDNEWDKIGTDDEFIGWMSDLLMALRPKLKPDYHLFLFCSPAYQARIELLLTGLGYPLKSRIVWSHRNLSMGRDVSDKFIENWEMAFHCGTHKLNWPDEWNQERFQVQEHAVPQSNFNDAKLHPTSKPIKLIELFVTVGSQPGGLVLDPFAGGGTTGEACLRNKRNCILIEKSAEYCRIIEDRLGITTCQA